MFRAGHLYKHKNSKDAMILVSGVFDFIGNTTLLVYWFTTKTHRFMGADAITVLDKDVDKWKEVK